MKTETYTREIAESPCRGSISGAGWSEEFSYTIPVFEPGEIIEGKRIKFKAKSSMETKAKTPKPRVR